MDQNEFPAYEGKPLAPNEQGPANDDGLATVGKWVVVCFFFFGLWVVLR